MQVARERLGRFPESGPSGEADVRSGLRTLVVGDYVFTYRSVDDEVRILFIRHGRQNRRIDETP